MNAKRPTPISPSLVRCWLAEIEEAMLSGDSEKAHKTEYSLYVAVMKVIARDTLKLSAAEMQIVAKEALKASRMDIERHWA